MRESRKPDADLAFLIRRAQAGDAQAFEGIARTYRDRMYRWALVRTGDEDDAEDAAQEALVRLHRGLGRFRGAARFETWVYAVTRSAVADVLRRRNRGRRLKERFTMLSEARSVGPDDMLEQVQSRRLAGLVVSFLRDLPPRQREAVDLVDMQGLSPAEAAARLALSPGTLRVHLHRGRHRLRILWLQRSGGEEGAR